MCHLGFKQKACSLLIKWIMLMLDQEGVWEEVMHPRPSLLYLPFSVVKGPNQDLKSKPCPICLKMITCSSFYFLTALLLHWKMRCIFPSIMSSLENRRNGCCCSYCDHTAEGRKVTLERTFPGRKYEVKDSATKFQVHSLT